MIIVSIFIGIVAVYCFVYFDRKKYAVYIEQNSVALKKLFEINRRYTFYPYVNFDQEHTYDNEKYYDTISCTDFLIYQLQYFDKKILAQIEKINENKRRYQKYLEEINALPFGEFQQSIGKLKLHKLLQMEKLKVESAVYKSPVTQFFVTVTLYRSTMNGQIYDRKKQSFSAPEIVTLTKRLRNKKGSFYNDRGVWDSLCRVERGKVSNRMRFSIYERDGYRCRRCGAHGKFAYLEIDHIIPISKGGKTVYENLQTLCHRCNTEKSDKLYY